jgi:hypothetical protein
MATEAVRGCTVRLNRRSTYASSRAPSLRSARGHSLPAPSISGKMPPLLHCCAVIGFHHILRSQCLAARSADLAEHTLQACKLAHLVISRRKPLPCRGDAATVSHAKNRNVLILDAINYDVLINGKTARAHTKIVVARTPQVRMAGKQENRSVME